MNTNIPVPTGYVPIVRNLAILGTSGSKRQLCNFVPHPFSHPCMTAAQYTASSLRFSFRITEMVRSSNSCVPHWGFPPAMRCPNGHVVATVASVPLLSRSPLPWSSNHSSFPLSLLRRRNHNFLQLLRQKRKHIPKSSHTLLQPILRREGNISFRKLSPFERLDNRHKCTESIPSRLFSAVTAIMSKIHCREL